MDMGHTITFLWERCRDWYANTDGILLMFQASLAVLVFEWIRRRGKLPWSGLAYSSCFANVLMILMNGALAPIFVILVDWAETAYSSLSIPHLEASTWQTTPTWILIPLILLALDFADYWNHRLMHSSKWFWPIHAIHHSDPHPTVLTTGRVHLLEPFVMQVSYILMLSWLNLPYAVLGGVAGLRILHNMYTHMNVDWDHGPFKYLLASPRYHRWHHADEPAAYGMNLANIFPFLDVIFCTYYVPGQCHEKMGAKGVPTNALEMVAWPFLEWNRLLTPKYKTIRHPASETSQSSDMVLHSPQS
ncbi:sterol desaturase family protein [Rubinisphaera italica]|uniref:Fatty acid hydroxylase superfamily protein n=1 Tax=Rubinisphaera italica TaxID=2527969 RepID=A0A5C5XG23_9PLAN|nr:sterol desaturase family protein [Rubinisphaera italica]TWT61323.1 Fatty acid hydroxylase superfamily protein [Rubinisphaera italica]